MIKLIEESGAACRSIEFCSMNGIGAKACIPLISYGMGFDFATTWMQLDDNKKLTAVISQLYGSTVVYAQDDADVNEINNFLKLYGYADLVSNVKLDGLHKAGFIMRLEQGRDFKGTPTADNVLITMDECYKDFYELITTNNPMNISSSFEDWYVDFSHRVRHNNAHFLVLKLGEEAVSGAAALISLSNSVFLGAISTNENYRGRHYAYTAVGELCKKYKERVVFLTCKPEKRSFYENAGFEKTGEFYAK